MTQTRVAFFFFALSLALRPCAAQETVLEILTVKNRPAESLLADLLPLAGPSGSVTASGSKLIVNASPASLAQIKRVLGELDVALRSLWISVRQGDSSREVAKKAQVTGRVDAAGGRTRTVVSGAFAQESGSATDETAQRVRALEGMPAFIRVSQSIALPTVAGPSVQEAETGFYVLPRLSGDLVTLDVATSKEAFSARGVVEGQRLLTTVNGRLGEWITIGGLSRNTDASGRGERWETAEQRVVSVLVEEIK